MNGLNMAKSNKREYDTDLIEPSKKRIRLSTDGDSGERINEDRTFQGDGSENVKKPEETNDIYITHKGQQCKFGAKLNTYQGRDYYTHTLKITNIELESPAEKMKIKDNDEIILFNEEFAPLLSHKEVRDRFLNIHVPVDGRTKFDLVISRKEKEKKMWKWYDSSAKLAPDDRKYPNVTAVSRVTTNEKKSKSVDMSYKIQGTNLWLKLDKAGATVSPGCSGAEKEVQRSITISQDPNTGAYFYNCTLKGCDCGKYVTIDAQNRSVKMQKNEPKPFRYGRRSEFICFSLDGLYLAYDKDDKDDKKITVSEKEYMFDEQPALGRSPDQKCKKNHLKRPSGGAIFAQGVIEKYLKRTIR